MKRYMELILALLRFAEQKADQSLELPPEIKGWTPEQVHYHVGLCREAGFLTASEESAAAPSSYRRHFISCLTWKGHEKLDELRSTNQPRAA